MPEEVLVGHFLDGASSPPPPLTNTFQSAKTNLYKQSQHNTKKEEYKNMKGEPTAKQQSKERLHLVILKEVTSKETWFLRFG